MTDLPCMNCGKPTPGDKAKLFAEVYVCDSCHLMATHFWARIERELRSLQVLAKDAIRVSLLEGKFVFAEGSSLADLPKRAVLETILDMDAAREARENRCTKDQSTQTAPYSATTRQSAPIRAAQAPGSLRKGYPPG